MEVLIVKRRRVCDVSAELSYECATEDIFVVTIKITGSSTYTIYKGLYVQHPFGTDITQHVNVPGWYLYLVLQ